MKPHIKISNIPLPANAIAAEHGQEVFKNDTSVPQELVAGVFGNSPYLGKLAEQNHEFVNDICANGFDTAFAKLMGGIRSGELAESKKELMAILRKAKAKASLLIGVADITNSWDLVKITNSLSDFADLAVQLAVEFLLKEKFHQRLVSSAEAEKSGFIVLAVGKLGGRELNYSSDIDLIVLYDADGSSYIGKLSAKEFFIRLTQELVDILQSRTADGYVFRTDLRLRPDPYSTPIAVSKQAAKIYYQKVGQNWERAAMIKARAIAGDIKKANEYLKFLDSFIWRKNLDFKAVEDIQSIKRQINSSQNYKPNNLLGYNIKLGKGGIREIEFFVQTQQLIWGGRELNLRCKTTCGGLRQLAKIGHISESAMDELIIAYEFYRRIEHRLQMVNDEHTHSLPKGEDGFKNFAVFLGYGDVQVFKNELAASLAMVQLHYAKLFEESSSLSMEKGGNLVFTGVTSDPETLLSIAKMGFHDPEKISEIIRGWHHGRREATTFKEVREILTELTPHILKSFAASGNPDEGFIKFDDFLTSVDNGLELFKLFEAKPTIINLIAVIMGNSPWLAESLSRWPVLLQHLLNTDFSAAPPNQDELREELDNALGDKTNFDQKISALRRWKQDKEFRAGVRLLMNFITHDKAAELLSIVAELVIDRLVKIIRIDENIDGELVVVAMGKLGIHELTFGSDLDLVFVYSSQSDNSNRFTKLVARFCSTMVALSADGGLYNVDTRLRPMGDKGALATSVAAYEKYYKESAWNWELMALTKARIISGESDLQSKVKQIINTKLSQPIEAKILANDMHKMRLKIAESFSEKDLWNVKYATGGMFEIEFIFQFYILTKSYLHPEIIKADFEDTPSALVREKIISNKYAEDLDTAYSFLKNIQSVIRLVFAKEFDEKSASDNQKQTLALALKLKDFGELKSRLVATENLVHDYYKRIFY